MQYDQYGQLLMQAISETLETMAFAEIIPNSIKIGDREIMECNESCLTTKRNASTASSAGGWAPFTETESEPDAWGETSIAQPSTPDSSDAWGDDAWSTGASPVADMSPVADVSPITDRMWANPLDAWEENVALPIPQVTQADNIQQVDFDQLVNEQEDWCWACMKVNSPELDCIWFIVSKQLAEELARTMYAGDDFELDNPALRDIIAELTNVLGGRLMLLLEEIVGKFTLEVPTTGTGLPDLPDGTQCETVTCKIFVDNTYPIISMMSFKESQ
ncbi:MAG: hypothetical protein FWD31_01545 [Planctomycetaceae bacterium]|nr:hypothetical protein [Planctomycetaceae bacterium]